MAKEFAYKFYHSKAWRDCRRSFIDSRILVDGGMCQCGTNCGQLGYIVDHIVELTPDNIDDPMISLNHENLQYLSLQCHNTKTFKKGKNKPRYKIVDGQVILLDTDTPY